MSRGSYYYGSGHNTKTERQSIMWIVAKIIFAVGALGFTLALILTLFVPVVNPKAGGLFPLLGVGAPITYIANFAVVMILIIRWKWKFALPIIVLLLIGRGKISRYAKMDFSTHYSEPNYKGSIKIMSYNLRAHVNDDSEWSTKELVQYFDSISPDILCVQEFNDRELKKHISPKLTKLNRASIPGLSIFSKYPIVAESEDISIKTESEGTSCSMWVDLKILNDTIRVFNNHLISTMINKSDDKYLTPQGIMADSLREYKFRNIAYRFQRSSIVRAQHAKALSEIIADSPYEVVVCGDFNDTPMSYVYRYMSRGLNDSFVESGVGYPYTYRGFMNLLRIDYILASQGIEFKSYVVDTDIKLSDHNPVISHFSIIK